MPNIPYTGTITLLYGGPNTCSNGSPLQPVNLNTTQQPITWAGTNILPTGFPETLGQFANFPNLFDVQYTLDINISGYPMSGDQGIIDVVIIDQNKITYPSYYLGDMTSNFGEVSYNGIYNYYLNTNKPYTPSCVQSCVLQECGDANNQQCYCCGSDNCYTYEYSAYNYCLSNGPAVPWQNKSFYPAGIYAVAYNYCGNNKNCNDGLCACHHFVNFNIVLTLNLSVTLLCTGKNLESGFCTSYCNIPQNYGHCLSDMGNYCFSPSDPELMPMGIFDGVCQKFYPGYITNSTYGGPSNDLDTQLSAYCSKYGTGPDGANGLNDLFAGNAPVRDQEICACHLNNSQYTAFKNSLMENYPGFNQFQEEAPCLVWQCASSPYKSMTTSNPCATPLCLDLAGFNNDGSFTKSKVKIVQSQNCVSLASAVPKNKSNKFLLLLVVIMAIILAIIFIVYISL